MPTMQVAEILSDVNKYKDVFDVFCSKNESTLTNN
jgi:hypothetical protein